MNTPAKFHRIDLDQWPRKEYFEYYFHKIKCKYTLNANIDITQLMAERKKRNLKFYPTFMYTIMRAINRNQEFRMSFEDGILGYWDYLVPSYTIFHEDDHTFSDVWSEYHESFALFYDTICNDIDKYKDVKGIKARKDRVANFCSISSVPWLSFTSFSQDTYSESDLLFPLIRYGKFFEENGKILLSFAIFVNHAVADGYHTSKLINEIQALAEDPKSWMDT